MLYSHFRSKDEIVRAIAVQGFTELAAALCDAASAGAEPRDAVAALARAYVGYAEQHPAVYDAMFSLSTGLPFAAADTPAPLHEAFAAMLATFERVAGDADPGLVTEIGWAALHGLVTLTRAGRLPPEQAAARLDVLVDRMSAPGQEPLARRRSRRGG